MPAARRLEQLVQDAGKKLGRSREDVKPMLSTLQENWYDTIDSLREVNDTELRELGLPLRFAKELLTLVQQESGGGRRTSSPEPVPRRDTKGKGKKGDRADSKGKGSSWDRDKGHEKDSYRDDSSTGRNHAKEEKGKGKGKSSGKSKGKEDSDSWSNGKSKGKSKGKDKDDQNAGVPPSQREYKYTHKITFDIEEIDESFPLGARIIGKDGKNVQHIHAQTGAWVWLAGKGSRRGKKGKGGDKESDEPLHVVVQSDDKKSLDEAIKFTNDLVDTVLEQYAAHVRGEDVDVVKDDESKTGHTRERAEKGRGKGKGKKGSGEPPAKKSRRD